MSAIPTILKFTRGTALLEIRISEREVDVTLWGARERLAHPQLASGFARHADVRLDRSSFTANPLPQLLWLGTAMFSLTDAEAEQVRIAIEQQTQRVAA